MDPVLARGHGPDLHPARRPRAERLDLHGPPGRVERRQPLRLHRRRRRLAVGPGARRGQRGGAQHADGDRQQGPDPGVPGAGQGPQRPLPADGASGTGSTRTTTRAPASCGRARTKCWRRSASRTSPCSNWPWSWRESRWRTSTSKRKKLFPNVDFYSGIILKAMGFPTSMFTVLFAMARTVGWIAQWKEMIEDPKQKIGRPRQVYQGPRRADLRSPGRAGVRLGALS